MDFAELYDNILLNVLYTKGNEICETLFYKDTYFFFIKIHAKVEDYSSSKDHNNN